MNIQIPYEILGDYDSLTVHTEPFCFRIEVRYEEASIIVTTNDTEIDYYDFNIRTLPGELRVSEVLPALLKYLEGQGLDNNLPVRTISRTFTGTLTRNERLKTMKLEMED